MMIVYYVDVLQKREYGIIEDCVGQLCRFKRVWFCEARKKIE